MLRYLTAGESHGKGLTAIIEGMPSGVKIDRQLIESYLLKRKTGYGRGTRQAIEGDTVEFLSGVRNGLTLGSPITLFIKNNDYENWKDVMGDDVADITKKTVTAPRPGHADLVGSEKYNFTDCRNVLERASARETAIRVAVSCVAMCLLKSLNIQTASYVTEICGVRDDNDYDFSYILENADKSPVRALNKSVEEAMLKKIDEARARKDTAGGKVKVVARGVKSGLGSYVQYDRKIDAHIAFSLMSIQAVKAVEVGSGNDFAEKFGSEILDSIYLSGEKIKRKTNNSGGIEGGMTNGEDIVFSCVMKPIPTLLSPLETVDIVTKKPCLASFERSDICAVPALSVICECALAFEIAKFILDEYKSDNIEELIKAWK